MLLVDLLTGRWRRQSDQRFDECEHRVSQVEAKLDELERGIAVVSRACDLIITVSKELQARIDRLEPRAEHADAQIVSLCEWADNLDKMAQGRGQ